MDQLRLLMKYTWVVLNANAFLWPASADLTSVVREQTSTSSHTVDESSWQTLGSFDFFRSFFEWLYAVLSCW